MVRRIKFEVPEQKLFSSISAQADNLGDIEIRLAALVLLSDKFHRHVIYTGPMPSGYVAMFRDLEADFLKSRTKFIGDLLMTVIRRRANILFAPGPVVLKSTVGAFVKSVVTLLVVSLVRLAGGRVYVLGRSLRGGSALFSFLERWLRRLSNLYTLRDDVSRLVLGGDATFLPDLALASEPGVAGGERRLVGVSLRYDRDHDVDLLREVVRRSEKAGKSVVFISQVQRDDAQHQKLANQLGCSVLLWQDAAHAEQFARLRKFYEQADLVFTDRLHVAILAARFGAFPVEVSGTTDKIDSTLRPWIDVPRVDSAEDLELFLGDEAGMSRRLRQQERLMVARKALVDALGVSASRI